MNSKGKDKNIKKISNGERDEHEKI